MVAHDIQRVFGPKNRIILISHSRVVTNSDKDERDGQDVVAYTTNAKFGAESEGAR